MLKSAGAVARLRVSGKLGSGVASHAPPRESFPARGARLAKPPLAGSLWRHKRPGRVSHKHSPLLEAHNQPKRAA